MLEFWVPLCRAWLHDHTLPFCLFKVLRDLQSEPNHFAVEGTKGY